MEDKICAAIILEMLGRPAEYLIKSMENIINKISEEKGTKVITRKIHDAKQVEKADNLFTTFAEIEVETESIDILFRLIFTYHPSHVDIINPEQLVLRNSNINLIANEIVMRIHQYDEIAKVLMVERNMLANKLRQAGIPVSETPSNMKVETQKQADKQVSKKIVKKKASKAKKKNKS